MAQEAVRTGKTIRQLVKEKGLLSQEDLDRVLDPVGMTSPRPRLDVKPARR